MRSDGARLAFLVPAGKLNEDVLGTTGDDSNQSFAHSRPSLCSESTISVAAAWRSPRQSLTMSSITAGRLRPDHVDYTMDPPAIQERNGDAGQTIWHLRAVRSADECLITQAITSLPGLG